MVGFLSIADAASFIGSLDNVLGAIIGGGPAANLGCKQCHGSTVTVQKGQPGALYPTTWPDTGIGLINRENVSKTPIRFGLFRPCTIQ
jgi:hypothetical protein